MSAMRRVWIGVLLVTVSGCASSIQMLPPRDNTLSYDLIVSSCFETTTGGTDSLWFNPDVRPSVIRVPPPRHPKPSWVVPPPRPPRPIPGPPPPTKLHPLLREWLNHTVAVRRETLLVTFRETLRIPALPTLDERQPRTSAANRATLLRTASIIRGIAARRDSAYRADSMDLVRSFDATVLHRHWLTHSMLVVMPLSRVRALAARHHVVYVQPMIGNEPPPSCPSAGTVTGNSYDPDDPIEARRLIQSDSFRALGLSYGYMSLLDTGVCPEHCLLDGASFGVAGDCVHGGIDCQGTTMSGFDTSDQSRSSGGHGTASAALLVGDGSMGDKWQGALDITLDYFQVFSSGACGTSGLCLNADAAAHAFESSLANGDRVILAELCSPASDWGAVGMSAQNAFDAGAVVVAANGNSGQDASTVQSPASAPCVIGVGAREISTLVTDAAQSCGPSFGNRIKPDIQAPTATETAETGTGACGESSLLGTHSGTSGATPFAGAAAALIRNWLTASGEPFEPGNIYAGLILSGRHYGSNLNQTEGAGLIELPTDGCAWWGTGYVTSTKGSQFALDLGSIDADSLEVAIWWPEDLAVDASGSAIVRHNNVDLAVIDPGGTVVVTGTQVDGIFERVTTHVGTKGTWTLEMQATSLYDPTAGQVVYWMAAARRSASPRRRRSSRAAPRARRTTGNRSGHAGSGGFPRRGGVASRSRRTSRAMWTLNEEAS